MANWWITGCAAGFGRALVDTLRVDGLPVGGVDIDDAALAALRTGPDDIRRFVRADVRDPGALEAALHGCFPDGADVVVANAGHGMFATVAEAPMAAVEDLFAVNVTGVAHTVRVALPSLRKRGGTLVVLSSVAGRTVFAESGWYAATKHAVEALAEAIWLENASFGVRVRIVEPGAYATRFGETARLHSPPRDPTGWYAPLYPAWDQHKAGQLAQAQVPKEVALAIRASVDRPAGLLRIPVGDDAEAMLGRLDAVGPDASARAFLPTR